MVSEEGYWDDFHGSKQKFFNNKEPKNAESTYLLL